MLALIITGIVAYLAIGIAVTVVLDRFVPTRDLPQVCGQEVTDNETVSVS